MPYLIFLWLIIMVTPVKAEPIVIAHRGASAYVPEHTLPAKAMAHAMGADFIEQDVVLSADDVPIVLHDIHLDSTTDVAQQFPQRARADGRYYARDFTLAEIEQLEVHERSQHDGDANERPVYPQRFPLQAGTGLKVATLAQEIDLILGLNASRDHSAGLYIELKAPQWHRKQGADIAAIVVELLRVKGLSAARDQVYLQCFDDATLRYLREQLDTQLPLIQLVADNSWDEDSEVDYNFLRSPEGLAYVASYAQGIGPWVNHIYQGRDAQGQPKLSALVAQAHAAGLLVHPYTLRQDDLPTGVTSFKELAKLLFVQAGVDGAFTDFPDLLRAYLDGKALSD